MVAEPRGGHGTGLAQLLEAGAPALIAEHGEQARLHAEQPFSILAMAAAYATVYDQTLQRWR